MHPTLIDLGFIDIPTYGVMGKFMKNSDSFAHGLNERAPVRSLYEALEFWNVVIRQLAGAPSADR